MKIKKIKSKLVKKKPSSPKPKNEVIKKPKILDEVKIPNTFGISKNLDKEEYEKFSNNIKEKAKQVADKNKWQNFSYILTAEKLIVRKR